MLHLKCQYFQTVLVLRGLSLFIGMGGYIFSEDLKKNDDPGPLLNEEKNGDPPRTKEKNDDPPREARKILNRRINRPLILHFAEPLKEKKWRPPLLNGEKMMTPLLEEEKNDDPPSKIVAPHANK